MGVDARLLDGFEVRAGAVRFAGRELEVRDFDNAGR